MEIKETICDSLKPIAAVNGDLYLLVKRRYIMFFDREVPRDNMPFYGHRFCIHNGKVWR